MDYSSVFRFRRIFVGCLLILGLPASACAQWSMGARSVAMAQAHSAIPVDLWAVFHNPAALHPKKAGLGFFAIRYYGLRELEDHAVTFSYPLKWLFASKNVSATLAAGIHTYGFDLYRRTQSRVGMALHFDRFSIGFTANYAHLQIKGYGSRGSPLFDAGIIAKISKHFRVGYRLTNVFNAGNKGAGADIHPAEMSGGISWNATAGVLITADVVKDLLHPVTLRTSTEISLPGGLYLRGGWTSLPFTWSAGAGIRIYRFSGNFAVQRHEVLGLSPGIDVQLVL